MSEGAEETVAQSPAPSEEPAQRESDVKTKSDEAPPNCIVKLRGLPWSSTTDDIISFFSDCEILNGRNGVHIVMTRDNRPTGEAYVEMSTSDDLNKALKHDRNHIGSRYIEVFRTGQSEFEWSIKRQNIGPTNEDACVKLRGLPFNCTKEEIATFFGGLELIPNGITLLMDGTGRSNGEAYVQFASMDNADQALKKHREKIGHRYIEIFRSSAADVRRYNNQRYFSGSMGGSSSSMMSGMNQRPGPYDRNMDRMNRYQNSSRSSRGFKDVWDSLNGSNGMSRDMPSRMSSGSLIGSGRFSSDLSSRMDGGGMGRLGSSMGGGFGGRMMNMDRMGSSLGMMEPGDRMGMSSMRGVLGSSMGSMSSGGGMGNMSSGMGNMGMSNNDRMSSGNGWSNNSGGGFGDNAGGGHYVHMRGLPYKARTCDIIEFFKPVVPIDILIKCQRNGRSTGAADVEFRTHSDALEGMTKDKSKMGHRYIELFLNSNNSMRGSGLRSSNF